MWMFSLSYAVCFNFAPICIIVRLAFVLVYLLILYCFACCMRCLCLSFLLSLCVVRRLVPHFRQCSVIVFIKSLSFSIIVEHKGFVFFSLHLW